MRFDKPKPRWITLIEPAEGDEEAPRGVRAKFAPPTRKMKRQAAAASRPALKGVDLSDQQRSLTDEELDALYDAGEASSHEFIKRALLDQPEPEWDGVLDLDGNPLPLNEETLDLVLAHDEFFDAADRLYVVPIADRDREKNGLSVSQNGTGGAATRGNAIARSPARPKKRAAAKAVRTRSTRSKRAKPKASGTS